MTLRYEVALSCNLTAVHVWLTLPVLITPLRCSVHAPFSSRSWIACRMMFPLSFR